MSAREWRVSILIAVFLGLKVAEAALGLDRWPISNVSMFSERRPVDVVPLRSRLVATRGSGWFDLAPADVRLSEDEFALRLRPSDDLPARCGALIGAYNALTREPWRRLEAAMVTIDPIPRPAIPTDVAGRVATCVAPDDRPGSSNGPHP